jgi:signal transduction histidine kinase
LEQAYLQCPDNNCSIQKALQLIDVWMDLENMDSAQHWANELFSILPADKQDVVHYYYNSRQSEIYYYNNFHRLGLQNAERGLKIAQTLQDSIFIADAYNFKGLFLMNLNRLKEAIDAFQQGLQWSVKHPHPAQYLYVTQYYHLLANLSEALFKNQQPAASLQYAHASLQEARLYGKRRAISIAQNQLGSCHNALGHADSAEYYFKACMADIDNDIDVLLLNYATLGMHYYKRHLLKQANSVFQEGVKLLNNKPDINTYFSIEFLNKSISFYSLTHQTKPLQECIHKKMLILEKAQRDYNVQINEVMDAALKNETQLLNMHIAAKERKDKLDQYKIITLSTLLVSLILIFLLYRNRLLKKLELAKLQQHIQQDLHDDLGGSLSIIRILSDLMSNKNLPQEEIIKLSQKISSTASEAAQKMNTIIWALNTANDTVGNLSEYIRQFSVGFFENTNVAITFTERLAVPERSINGTARKNIFLCIKEALHNVLKHAKATEVHIAIETTDTHLLKISITDNGVGLQNQNAFGNGLKNLQHRMADIGGKTSITNANGVVVAFEITLP